MCILERFFTVSIYVCRVNKNTIPVLEVHREDAKPCPRRFPLPIPTSKSYHLISVPYAITVKTYQVSNIDTFQYVCTVGTGARKPKTIAYVFPFAVFCHLKDLIVSVDTDPCRLEFFPHRLEPAGCHDRSVYLQKIQLLSAQNRLCFQRCPL